MQKLQVLVEKYNEDNGYLKFLRDDLPNLLEDVALRTGAFIWPFYDGAPPHFSLGDRMYLNEPFRNHWIWRGGPATWAPRLPDPNPTDFFLLGH